MRKYTKLILLSLSVTLFAACENESGSESENGENDGPVSIDEQKESIYESDGTGDEHYLQLVDREAPTWAGISHSSRFGSVNTDYIVETTDEETLQFIVDEMIEGSVRQPGIVSMSEPYYGMSIDYEDGSSEMFHLWITPDDSSGTIMVASDTHYIYTFSEGVSEQFLSLIPEEHILDSPVYAEWVEDDSFGITEVIVPYSGDSLNELIMYSDYIVRGSYLHEEPTDVPGSWGDENMAFYSFEVDEILKGELDSDVIEVGHPEYIIPFIREPETGADLGTVSLENPFTASLDPERDTLLFFREGMEEGEFWRFSVPSMIEVLDDGTLRSMSPYFDGAFDFSERIERFDVDEGWEVEITLEIVDEDLPLSDPFDGMMLNELIDMIN